MEHIPKDRIFASASDYEANVNLKQKRELLITVIDKIKDIMDEVGSEDEVVKESKIEELNQLAVELEAMGITKQYLEEFTEGDGRFTESARKDPEIMIKWIAHDLLKIIRSVPKSMTVSGFRAQLGEFSDIEGDKGETPMGFMRGEDLTKPMADFMGRQQAISFYLNVLDVQESD